jgi:hypothetical protein
VTGYAIGTGIILAAAAAGAYIRWGVIPVLVAYEIGRRVERIRRRLPR